MQGKESESICSSERKHRLCARKFAATQNKLWVSPMSNTSTKPTLSSGTKKKVPIGSTCTNDDAKVPRSLKKTMSWDLIKGRKRLVKFYTGCPTAEIFTFIVDQMFDQNIKNCNITVVRHPLQQHPRNTK